MPSLQALRRKIGGVKSTQKITKAMKMVAAAKLRRAQERALAGRPYAERMSDIFHRVSGRVNRSIHPLFAERPVKRVEVLVITSDRGLCGSFNVNVQRRAVEFLRAREGEGVDVRMSLVGRKGRDFFQRRKWTVRKEWTGIFDRLSIEHATEMAEDLVDRYVSQDLDELYVFYNYYWSVMKQKVTPERLLPIKPPEDARFSGGAYLYEPEEEALLPLLLPKFIQVRLFHILLESSAAEFAARMMAMDGATRNANELLKKLTLVYNKSRQSAITKELLDIVSGAEALK